MHDLAERKIDARLKALYDKGVEVFSISKLDTINNCLYEAYRTYKLHERGENNIYGIMGTKIHDTLEGIILGKNTESDLLLAVNSELEEMEMLGIDFPKDRTGGDSIKNGWMQNMNHFCNTFVCPKGDFKTEEFFLYTTKNGVVVQGYIDLIRTNKNETISIFDWKTSSMYSKSELLSHGRQLIIYALAKEQEGFTVDRVAWIMIKYCTCTFMGKARLNSKQETKITKVMERKKIVQELERYIVADLEKLGFDDVEILELIQTAKQEISLNSLPVEIQQKYIIKPYVMEYQLTDELREETISYIEQTAELWNGLKRESQFHPRKFYKKTKYGKQQEDTFFCVNLCNHRATCPHLKKHNAIKGDRLNNLDKDLF